MSRALRVLLSLVAVVGVASVAQAQNCVGAPAFSVGMVRLAGTVDFADSLKTYGGDLSIGRDKGFYLHGNLSHSKLNDFDGSSNQGGGSIGYQVAIDPSWQFCPFVGVNAQSGSVIGASPSPNSPWNNFDVYAGGSLGWVAANSGDTQVIPAVGLALANRHSTSKIVQLGTSAATRTDNFGYATGAIGFVFNKRWTITPNVNIPFKEDDGKTTYGVSLSLNFNTPNWKR